MSPDPEEPRVAPTGVDPDLQIMRQAVESLLAGAGLPDAAAGDAPAKAATAWADHLLIGYASDPVEILRPTWSDRSGDMVTVHSVPFVSVCSHHLLPFFGKAHVAYLPDGELTGLSRIEEMIHCLSRRLQLQERLGEEIVDAIAEATGARGVACVLEAEHLCVFARGRRQRGSVTQTFCFRGEFEDDAGLQDRALRWLLSDRIER